MQYEDMSSERSSFYYGFRNGVTVTYHEFLYYILIKLDLKNKNKSPCINSKLFTYARIDRRMERNITLALGLEFEPKTFSLVEGSKEAGADSI